MTKQDARTLSPAQQEAIRRNTVVLAQEGIPQAQIARELGVSRSAISGWISAWRRDGETALSSSRKRGRPYGTGRLTVEQKTWLSALVANKTPEQIGCDALLWSNAAIRTLIRNQWGISLTKPAISLLMRQLEFMPPTPAFGGICTYDEGVSQCIVWRLAVYPRIKSLARRQKAKILLFDEKAMNESPFYVFSAIDGRGTLRFVTVHPPVTPQKRINFLERLATECGRPVLLLLDSHPNHDNGPIRRWQRQNANLLTLCHIPIRDLALLPAQCWPFKKAKKA